MNATSQILIYQTENGKTKIETRLEDESVWLTIDQMGDLFQKSRSTINEHILNIYKEEELTQNDSMRKIGNSDFSTKPTNYYNLDIIIAVGYRVKSPQGTKFRQWATQRLDDFLKMTGKEILQNAGTISHTEALQKAHEEYEQYKEKTKNELSHIEKDFVGYLETLPNKKIDTL